MTLFEEAVEAVNTITEDKRMKKYASVRYKHNEFVDYTNTQLLKLIDSQQANGLERSDLIHIIRELAYRNEVLEKALSKF